MTRPRVDTIRREGTHDPRSPAATLPRFAHEQGRQQLVEEALPHSSVSSSTDGPRRNTDAHWEWFDPEAYFKQNYATLRDDDKQILEITGEYFARNMPVDDGNERRAIDVGAGVNLYPSMAMLPFCGSITLYEYARPNVDWLRRHKREAWKNSWKDCAPRFWGVLKNLPHGPHGTVESPLKRLTDQIEIRRGSIYDLRCDKPWDLGTMFFVAESITEDPDQCQQGIDRFLNALTVGAPFVIAFMEHRLNGYHVAGESFPSTDIDESDIRKYLEEKTQLDDVQHIGVDHTPLDDPYSGMVVACGRTRASDSPGSAPDME